MVFHVWTFPPLSCFASPPLLSAPPRRPCERQRSTESSLVAVKRPHLTHSVLSSSANQVSLSGYSRAPTGLPSNPVPIALLLAQIAPSNPNRPFLKIKPTLLPVSPLTFPEVVSTFLFFNFWSLLLSGHHHSLIFSPLGCVDTLSASHWPPKSPTSSALPPHTHFSGITQPHPWTTDPFPGLVPFIHCGRKRTLKKKRSLLAIGG